MAVQARVYELHAEICKALGHPKRLEILDALRDGEFTVEEISRRVGIEGSSLSQHLGVLKKVSLVLSRRDGLNVYYRLRDRRIIEACDLLKRVLIGGLNESARLISELTKT